MEITMKHFDVLLEKVNKFSKNTGDWSSMSYIFDKMISHYSEYHVEEFKDIFLKLYTKTFNYTFDADMVTLSVSNMKNKDGTIGAHWSLDQVRDVIASKKIDVVSSYNEFDFYYVISMMYSDYYNENLTPDEVVDYYVDLSLDFLEDVDSVGKYKAMRYWVKIALWQPED